MRTLFTLAVILSSLNAFATSNPVQIVRGGYIDENGMLAVKVGHPITLRFAPSFILRNPVDGDREILANATPFPIVMPYGNIPETEVVSKYLFCGGALAADPDQPNLKMFAPARSSDYQSAMEKLTFGAFSRDLFHSTFGAYSYLIIPKGKNEVTITMEAHDDFHGSSLAYLNFAGQGAPRYSFYLKDQFKGKVPNDTSEMFPPQIEHRANGKYKELLTKCTKPTHSIRIRLVK
jgi:hypothetical protein